MSLFVFFISFLIVAQHVSGNHVHIIRSWRLCDVIASCWYVVLHRHVSLWVGCVWIWGFFWCWFHCCMYFNLITNRTRPTYNNETPKNPHIHRQPTHSETCLCNTTYCYSTYQHEAITSRSHQLLMMGTWLPETYWATIRREIKNIKTDI